MSAPDRIREFEAANALLARAKEDKSNAVKDVDTQKGLIQLTRQLLSAQEEELKNREARVEVLKNREEEAESNLRDVEERFQVINVDGGSETNTPASMSIVDTREDTNDDVDRGIGAISSNADNQASDGETSNSVNVISDNSSVSSEEDNEVSSTFFFDEIVVEGCGEPGVNGLYKPYKNSAPGLVYSKRGSLQGHETTFFLTHCRDNANLWSWVIGPECNSIIYIAGERNWLGNMSPQGNDWKSRGTSRPPQRLLGRRMRRSRTSPLGFNFPDFLFA